jgi:protein-S-isoprenylcysteine O-methyltransferase Ste14
MPKTASVGGYVLMVAGIVLLFYSGAFFATRPVTIAIQIAAALLMIAARITFGRRSFHLAANPTAGGLVSTGPYAYFRHPIYAAVMYFVWAAFADHVGWLPAAAAALITVGAFVRMSIEERMVAERYPEYREYKARVRRIIPFVY